MAGRKPHRLGTYETRATRIVAAANANPNTRCWRCGRTLAEHPNTKTGKPPSWNAGHIIDGQVEGELKPEVDVCNKTHGARMRQAKHRNPTSRAW